MSNPISTSSKYPSGIDGWSIFDDLYHKFYDFISDIDYVAQGIGAVDPESRADFVLHRMVKTAQADLEALWEKGSCERGQVGSNVVPFAAKKVS